MTSAPRSALSEGLLTSSLRSTRDNPITVTPDPIPEQLAERRTSALSASPSRYGRSPLIGSPWPYLVRRSSVGHPSPVPDDAEEVRLTGTFGAQLLLMRSGRLYSGLCSGAEQVCSVRSASKATLTAGLLLC